jgi:hypothetical protein
MLKRLCTVLLSAGLLLGLAPVAASASTPVAATAHGLSDHRDDDHHYRCMYRCGRRYDKDRHRYRRDGRRYCWYRDRYGWYRAPCRRYYYRDYDR